MPPQFKPEKFAGDISLKEVGDLNISNLSAQKRFPYQFTLSIFTV
jgi:hypothetical protein